MGYQEVCELVLGTTLIIFSLTLMHLFLYAVISYMKWLRKILSMDFPWKITAKHVHLERYTALEADVSLGEKTVIEETQEMDAWLVDHCCALLILDLQDFLRHPRHESQGMKRRENIYPLVSITHWSKMAPWAFTPHTAGCVVHGGQQFCQGILMH